MSLESPNNKRNSLFPAQDEESEDDDSWQVSYLDIITILLGFLVILLSFSELNDGSSFSVSDLFKNSQNETEFITTPIDEIKKELENLLKPEIDAGKLEIFRELNDVRIRFKSDDLYNSGSAQLQDDATEILNRVLAAFKLIQYNDFEIDVEGHTDNVPISSSAFPSNWELSTSRASNIVRYLSKMGLPQERLKASGYADSRPLVNFDSQGNPMPANKDENRRVVLRLYYSNPELVAGADSVLLSNESEINTDSSTILEDIAESISSEVAKNDEEIALTNSTPEFSDNENISTSVTQPKSNPQNTDIPSTTTPRKVVTDAVGCSYAVQLGNFESFIQSLNIANEAERQTGYTFDITYNNRLFSVRTTSKGSFSEVLNVQQDIISKMGEDLVLGIIQQCYENTSKRPRPITYQIQLGFFQNEENAVNFKETVDTEFNIETVIDQMSLQAYTVLTKPISSRRRVEQRLQEIKTIDELNNAFIKYDPKSVSEYTFLYQIQIASFSNRKDADVFSQRIKAEIGLESSTKLYDGNNRYYLVSRPFSNWDEVLSMYEIFTRDSSDFTPIIYLIERVK